MSKENSSYNKIRSWRTYILLISSLLLTIFYYYNESSGMQITRLRPFVLWMHGSMPMIAVAIALFATIIVFRWKKIEIIASSKCLLLTSLVCAVFFFVFNPWAISKWGQLPLSIVMSAAIFYISSSLLGRLTYFVWPPVFFLSHVIYAAKHQHIEITSDKLIQIFGTSWQDASFYFTFWNLFLCVIALLLSVTAWHFMYLIIKRTNRQTLFSSGLLLLFPALITMFGMRSNIVVNSKYVWPVGITQQLVYDSFQARKSMKNINHLLAMLPQETVEASIQADSQYTGAICILHIGESVSANHLKINGYERDTSPWITNEKGIINFKDCVASAIVTDRAILTMITNARRDFINETNPEYLPSSPCLVDFFKISGFKCATYWAAPYLNEPNNGILSQQIAYFNRLADATFGFNEPFYMEQLPDIFNFIKENEGENRFLMINNTGSHAFFTGYDTNNPPFPVSKTPQPDMTPASNPEHAEIFTNAYDCTIHYTDKYISKIVNHLKGKAFIYIYMSDHGEYLGDHGYWQRNQAPFEQFHEHQPSKVPFFIYASPEFEAMNPHFKAALNQLKANCNIGTAHEHLFHTVLGIMNIQTSHYNETLDLSSPSVKPYTGPHPDRVDKN